VRDGDVLHVLHRETDDGRCEEIEQGPLHTCDNAEYVLQADIRVSHGAALRELVQDEGKPIECGVDHYGSKLVPPLASKNAARGASIGP
jgi:hypothetical protein